jgi:oxygen-independent coproporphyrinogen-3 oxidase
VYIGGGTPTTLSAEQLEMIFKKLSEHISLDSLAEFTLEAGRPDTITAEKLSVAKKYGVTRISVNPQTLSDEILREIGRRHTTEDFYRAYALAKESGIRDINVDLIAGLPGDDFKNFSDTIDKILELEPTNITVHTFCVKKAAEVLKQNTGIYSVSGDDAHKCISYSQLKTKFKGYKPYYMYKQKNAVGNLENVGFSIDGHEGLYNIFMMEELQTIFACGAGAVTKLVKRNEKTGYNDIKRLFNAKYPYEYLNVAESPELSLAKREKDYLEIINFFK